MTREEAFLPVNDGKRFFSVFREKDLVVLFQDHAEYGAVDSFILHDEDQPPAVGRMELRLIVPHMGHLLSEYNFSRGLQDCRHRESDSRTADKNRTVYPLYHVKGILQDLPAKFNRSLMLFSSRHRGAGNNFGGG